MSEPITRVPFGRFDPDVKMSHASFREGRRYSMDVSNELLAQCGEMAIKEAASQLGRHIAYEEQSRLHSLVVNTLVENPEWVKAVIEQELRKAARAMVLSLWSDDEKKALRDWFDLFTASILATAPTTEEPAK